jgi:hypothetical protein
MPSGDRSRTWFPEMVEELKQSWRSDLGMDELIALAHRLDCLLRDIRTKRGIRSPTILCRKCGKRGPAAAPRVSVRAMILAAERFGIGQRGDVGQIERLWNRHRITERLDLYGRPVVAEKGGNAAQPDGCTGHTARGGEP